MNYRPVPPGQDRPLSFFNFIHPSALFGLAMALGGTFLDLAAVRPFLSFLDVILCSGKLLLAIRQIAAAKRAYELYLREWRRDRI